MTTVQEGYDRAERRRLVRELIAVAAAVALVGGGIAVREATRAPDPRTVATRDALAAVARTGGPAGWAVTAPAGLPPDHTEIGLREGITVAVFDDGHDNETGFTVSWEQAASPAACDALAEWARRTVQHEAPDTTRAVCRDVARSSRHGAPKFDSFGSPDGRYEYHADATPDGRLVASLSYRAPGG